MNVCVSDESELRNLTKLRESNQVKKPKESKRPRFSNCRRIKHIDAFLTHSVHAIGYMYGELINIDAQTLHDKNEP